MKPLLITCVGIALAALAGQALAHGDATHAKKPVLPHPAEQHSFGIAGNLAKATRTIVFDMSDDMRFDPSHIEVRRGETVRFVAHNKGKVMHEMVLGTMKDLKEHAALMKRFPAMEHEDAHMAHVAPGQTGEIIWRFNRAGRFNFACLIPGHFEAGMVGTVTVR
jgi:uncharacterized cupredoxin-like copper-binding protein